MLGLFIWAQFCTVDVSSVLLAPIKMPTREEKKVSATTWHVYLARTPKLESHKIRLEKACPEARATSITYRSLGNAVVELRWQRAVKHDNVCNFISKHVLAEGFSVRPQIAPAAVSVAQGGFARRFCHSVYRCSSWFRRDCKRRFHRWYLNMQRFVFEACEGAE